MIVRSYSAPAPYTRGVGELALSLKPPKWLRKAQPLKAVAKAVSTIAPIASVVLPALAPLGIAAAGANLAKAKGFASLIKLGKAVTPAITAARTVANVVGGSAPALPVASGIGARIAQRVLELRQATTMPVTPALPAVLTPEPTTPPAGDAPGPSPATAPSASPTPPTFQPAAAAVPVSIPAPASSDAVSTPATSGGVSPVVIGGLVLGGLLLMSSSRKGNR